MDRLGQLVFLPGYPLVVRAVMRLISSDICAGLLTSALCFAGAGCVHRRLLGEGGRCRRHAGRRPWNQNVAGVLALTITASPSPTLRKRCGTRLSK